MSTSRNDKNRVVAFAGVPCQLPGLRQGPTGPVFESWQEQGCQARICPSPDLAAYVLPLFTWAVTTAPSPVPPSGLSLPWHRALPPHLLSGHCMSLRSPAAPPTAILGCLATCILASLLPKKQREFHAVLCTSVRRKTYFH